jgi:hypothetical protein
VAERIGRSLSVGRSDVSGGEWDWYGAGGEVGFYGVWSDCSVGQGGRAGQAILSGPGWEQADSGSGVDRESRGA